MKADLDNMNSNTAKNRSLSPSFFMIFIMAWRNIWRNKTRSRVVMGAVMIGIWAAVFMTGLSTGMVKSYVSAAVDDIVSHIQIHHSSFIEDRESKYYLENGAEMLEKVLTMPEVKTAGNRTIVTGMISTGRGAEGVEIKGVDPETEIKLTTFDEKIIEGDYFQDNKRNQILISEELAEQLQIKLKRKVVLTFQNIDGEITASAFRIVGFFDTGNNIFDKSNVFVRKADLNKAYISEESKYNLTHERKDLAHEIAMLLIDIDQLETVRNKLIQSFPGLSIKTYREISPDLELYESMIGVISYIYLVLILLALVFGIINTMLMAVLERIAELGMLMAIGMNKLKIFLMVVFETVLLGIVAVPFGVILGFLTISILGRIGINLSAWSESLQEFGMQDLIYPEVLPEVYWQMALGIFITMVLASIYPAFRAIRLRPVEAIRKL